MSASGQERRFDVRDMSALPRISTVETMEANCTGRVVERALEATSAATILALVVCRSMSRYRAANGSPNQNGAPIKVSSGHVLFFAGPRTGTAHVVQLGPVGV